MRIPYVTPNGCHWAWTEKWKYNAFETTTQNYTTLLRSKAYFLIYFFYHHIKSSLWQLKGTYCDLRSESLSVADRQKKW